MLSVFCSPSRYTQGKGATAALGREMAALGLEGPALIKRNSVCSERWFFAFFFLRISWRRIHSSSLIAPFILSI